ncbi:MAG TPA: hypothetical protein VN964_14445 [Gemmatimonadales bacterium]|nr:hypothetical protein [Gemmatimonadales bacterium]
MIGLLIAAAALGGGFVGARNFVRRRLRFVAAVRRPAAPLVAGLAATAVALPIAALPIVTIGTAVAFGVGVASGVVSGRREPPRDA